ncbi:MAG: hypothetical protein WBA28_09205 [Microbacteriaceae bacterium]
MSMVLDGVNPRSRSSDPVTSVDAGRLANLSRSQEAVYATMQEVGYPVADIVLEKILADDWSPSRVRSARSELVAQGLVKHHDYMDGPRGRRMQTWKLVPVETDWSLF